MKKIVLCIFVILGFSETSLAYTSCPNQTLTKVFSDSVNTYLGTGGLNGIIRKTTTVDYQTMVSIALAAKISGTPVEIRYKRDGVICGSAAWNEEISGVGV